MRPTSSLQRFTRKFALTTKRVPNGYYKGNRTGKIGTHTKHGGYVIDYDLVRTYVAPSPQVLQQLTLTPFVTLRKPVQAGRRDEGTGPPNGEWYLDAWKRENGDD